MNHPHIKELKEKVEHVVNSLKEEMLAFRTNRPTTKPVENVKVKYMETDMTVKQLATITLEPPRDIVITPWDKTSLSAIEKGIQESNLGLTVANQGNSLRLRLPELTEERKTELIKTTKSLAEESRIKVRTMRDDTKKKIESELADEDERFRAKEEMQKEIDKTNKSIDELIDNKIKEIQE